MGIEFDIVSDAAREGYELGKGPWDSDFEAALRAPDTMASVLAFLEGENFPSGLEDAAARAMYQRDIARDIAAFVRAHPDWKILNDASDDYDVLTDEERRQREVDLGEDGGDDPYWPLYRKVGSRYRGTP